MILMNVVLTLFNSLMYSLCFFHLFVLTHIRCVCPNRFKIKYWLWTSKLDFELIGWLKTFGYMSLATCFVLINSVHYPSLDVAVRFIIGCVPVGRCQNTVKHCFTSCFHRSTFICVFVCVFACALQEVSEPTKEEKAVAKYLRFNCPTKSTNMMGHRVDYFIG